VLYHSPILLRHDLGRATIFEDLFAANGWTDSWRDGICEFLDLHRHRHEVLGIANGRVQIEFGGRNGRRMERKADDVAELAAGTGHCPFGLAPGLLVVGAYQSGSGAYDQPRPRPRIMRRRSGTSGRFQRSNAILFTGHAAQFVRIGDKLGVAAKGMGRVYCESLRFGRVL
jgi:uncharacterized protein YjlB